jgi:membrane fusion protein, multidrug efflux system
MFLLLASLSGCGEAPQKAGPAQPSPDVTIFKVGAELLKPTITFTGRVQARDRVDLRARVEGFLEKRLFTEGQDVKEGDLLFTIEKGQYRAAIEQINGTILKAEAALKLSNVEVQRQQTLVTKEVGTQAKLDQVHAKQGEAQGDLAQQKAALDNAQLNLGYTDIRAPISGRIGRSTFSVGNFVTPSAGTLATIVSQDPIYVTFPVTQREMLAIRKTKGTSSNDAVIHVQLADGTRYPTPGKVDFVDVTVNQGTDTVQVRAVFPNPDRILVDGQLVNVTAESGNSESALVIPQQAIQVDQSGTFVLVVDTDNKVEVRRVQIARGAGDRVTVQKGLSAGERVMTEGIQKVRPGQTVQANEAAEPGA